MTPSKTAAFIQKKSQSKPRLGLVLGSGFSAAVDVLKVESEFSFRELAGFPIIRVQGHAGRLFLGALSGVSVAVLSGRAHYYEGFSMQQVTFPVRVMAALGIEDLLLTNAAGGINRRLTPGSFMYLKDHLNFIGDNPLRGVRTNGQIHFQDLTDTYDDGLNRLLVRAGRVAGVRVQGGVYAGVAGPTYETPAEIRAFARLGADAVGMSTVPEAIVARHCGLGVAALSCITNVAAGLGNAKLDHADVLACGERAKEQSTKLLQSFVKLYADR